MTKPEITAIAPFFIVRDVPAAMAFYRDRFGFEITFQDTCCFSVVLVTPRKGRHLSRQP